MARAVSLTCSTINNHCEQSIPKRYSYDDRVPAQTLETIVIEDLLELLKDSTRLLAAIEPLKLSATEQQALNEQASQFSEIWPQMETLQQIEHLSKIVRKIILTRWKMSIDYSIAGITNDLLLHSDLQGEEIHQTETHMQLKRCGVETKLIVENTLTTQLQKPHPDSVRAIQEAVKKGLMWNQALVNGEAQTAKELASADCVSDRYVSQLIRLASLSPMIIQRIFRGDIPHDLTLGKLKANIPLDWNEQEVIFS